MNRKLTSMAVAGALAVCGPLAASAQEYRLGDSPFAFRIGPAAPEWSLNAEEGQCRIKVFVDDTAQIQLRGDQVIVNTQSGRRSYDQGSVCTQPLPFYRVDNFRVVKEQGRGRITDVYPPNRRNNFTGTVTVEDSQRGGDNYELVVAWRNPEGRGSPLVSSDPYPYYDETRACQDRVRSDFVARNSESEDAYVEFAGVPLRDEVGPNRERIRGDAWVRLRARSRPITYECILNDRTNRVLTTSFEWRGSRYSSR
jgi:hypothetical protein